MSAGDSSSQAADKSAPVKRNNDGLQELLRKRREDCQEYESRTPDSSRADVHHQSAVAASAKVELVFESAPKGSTADAAHGGAATAGSALVFESVPEQSRADAVHSGHTARRASITKGRSSIVELNSWKKQLQGRKEAKVTSPATAETQANEAEPAQADKADTAACALPACTSNESIEPIETSSATSPTKSPTKRTSIDLSNSPGLDLTDFMSQMKSRCDSEEPTATTPASDTVKVEVDGKSPLSSDSGVLEPAEVDMATMRECLYAGGSLSHASRSKLWAAQLGCSPQDPTPECEVSDSIMNLLGAKVENEEVLFDVAGDAPPKSEQLRLAAAFTEKHLDWIPLHHTPAEITKLFAVMAQLLRYHSPAAACMIESASLPLGLDLTAALCLVAHKVENEDAGAAGSLQDVLFTASNKAESEAMLRLCDLVVIEDEELLSFFCALACLIQVSFKRAPTLDSLRQELRNGLTLRSLGAFASVTAGIALLESTPVTLISLLASGRAGPPSSLPMCTVTADELLHHIYERPSRPWRLVVVDARMTSDKQRLVLPISIMLGATPFKERRQVLTDIPYEESIHLCLMGDNDPAPGDDAFELCRYLLSSKVQRKHVSVVEGGWPAVEAFVKLAHLDLMPAEAEEEKAGGGSASGGYLPTTSQAREAVGEVAVVGQKVAQKMWAGAGRLFGAAQKTSSEEGTQKSQADIKQ